MPKNAWPLLPLVVADVPVRIQAFAKLSLAGWACVVSTVSPAKQAILRARNIFFIWISSMDGERLGKMRTKNHGLDLKTLIEEGGYTYKRVTATLQEGHADDTDVI